jgi:hypothetical protein
MSLLRERLLRESPVLHEALLKSWEVASGKWLSSIKTSLGSYNSAPHFRNIEGHLERLLVEPKEREPDALRVPLSTLELYLLLASVLFHDVGRVTDDMDHPYHSQALLKERYRDLGIPNRELAHSLGRIAPVHDPGHKYSPPEVKRNEIHEAIEALEDVVIEPFGRARELYVAALLALGDHLDASVARTEPVYVRSDGEVDIKGAFRRLVLGSYYDPATECIKTSLDCSCLEYSNTNWNNAFTLEFDEPDWLKKARSDSDWVKRTKDLEQLRELLEVRKKLEDQIGRDQAGFLNLPPNKGTELYRDIGLHKVQTPRKLFECALRTNQKIPIILKRKKNEKGVWPPDYLFATVLNDLGKNREFLRESQEYFDEMGLPVRAWLIEYKGKTYGPDGEPEPEPVFFDRFLRSVADGIIDLSCHAFAHGRFTYEVLANYLRETNTGLVRRAVFFLKANPAKAQRLQKVLTNGLELAANPSSWELRRKRTS